MVKIIIASLGMITAYVITKILNIDDFTRGLIVMWCYFVILNGCDLIKKLKQ
jgi:hypothetical protein